MNNPLGHQSVYNGAVGKNNTELDESGPCVLCGTRSVCKCQRCGDLYCSPQCQRKDWPNHRYICFPMPPLVKASNFSPLKQNEIVGDKIPILQCETPLNLKEAHPESTKIPSSESCVILTSFSAVNCCYIRSTNPSDQENYKEVLREIDNFGKKAPGLKGKPQPNSYALTLKEGKWCRVQIIENTLPRRLIVKFVDYGHTTKRQLHELRQINNHIISLPCFVHFIKLKDVNVLTESRPLEVLYKYINQEFKLVLEEKDTSGGNAKLFNWKTKVLLNAEIVKLCCQLSDNTKNIEAELVSNVSHSTNVATQYKNGLVNKTSKKNSYQNKREVHKENSPIIATEECKNDNQNSPTSSSTITQKKLEQQPPQIQTQKPCMEPPFEVCPLNKNDRNCKVIITDDSCAEMGYIGCLLEKYCENLKEVNKFLKENHISDQPYKPKLNEYCLAEFENEWYRAKVMEIISDDKYRIVYIDFTNEMELTSKSIRPYPMSLTVPCHTTLCAIDDLPEVFSDKLKDFLNSECAAFNILHIDEVRIEGDVTFVVSKELLKKLHDNKLL